MWNVETYIMKSVKSVLADTKLNMMLVKSIAATRLSTKLNIVELLVQ